MICACLLINTGKPPHCDVTDEMIKFNLHKQKRWVLATPPSDRFYADLHSVLKSKRIPADEIGLIYRSIDPALSSVNNTDAYRKVQHLLNNYTEQIHPGDDSQSDSE